MSQIKCSNRWCSSTSTSLHFMMEVLLLLFTCSSLLQHVMVVHAAVGVNDARFVYNKSKTDVNAAESTDTDTNVQLLDENETDPIPMDFYRQLNNITDISEFIEKFIDPNSIDPKYGIHENLRRNVERASFIRAKAANCIPEPTVVELTPSNPKNNYFPKCTRVKRCGGCCSTSWMSCQPTKTEIVNYQVYRYCYEHGVTLCGFDNVPVEQHLECKCDCRVKPKDCNTYQVYDNCRCHCKNTAARDKCLELNYKDWDENTCRCVCRQTESCTTGSYYDENHCKCLLDCNAFQVYEDCRCHCTNTDARDKCLELNYKDWDDNTCRCVCRQTESCTTGTYYDENQCKCLLLPGNSSNDGDVAVPSSTVAVDRRRFIVKAIPVESDNSTIYEV